MLWEISGNGLSHKSYLFGTMHGGGHNFTQKEIFTAFPQLGEVLDNVSCMYLEQSKNFNDSAVVADCMASASVFMKADEASDYNTLPQGESLPELGAACGGGGRYDKMIGKFTGNDVPACGFSIGFERIILLLMESGFKIPESPKKVAYLVEKKYPADKLVDVMNQAKDARANGQQVLVVRMNKNKKFQKEQLMKEGYEEFVEFFNR